MTTVIFDGKCLIADTAVTQGVKKIGGKVSRNVEDGSPVSTIYGHTCKIKVVPLDLLKTSDIP